MKSVKKIFVFAGEALLLLVVATVMAFLSWWKNRRDRKSWERQ